MLRSLRVLGDPKLEGPAPFTSTSSGGSERGLEVIDRGLPLELVVCDNPFTPFATAPGIGVPDFSSVSFSPSRDLLSDGELRTPSEKCS